MVSGRREGNSARKSLLLLLLLLILTTPMSAAVCATASAGQQHSTAMPTGEGANHRAGGLHAGYSLSWA